MKTIPVGKHEVIVDDWNYELVRSLRLNASGTVGGVGHVNAYFGPSGARLHVPLAKVLITTDAPMVDHKDHNWLNHQESNLRPCTRAQNNANCRKRRFRNGRPTTSRYKGVTWFRARGKWIVHIGHNNKQIYIGYFTNEQDAARAYDAKARELFGEFAVLNFPLQTS